MMFVPLFQQLLLSGLPEAKKFMATRGQKLKIHTKVKDKNKKLQVIC